MIFYNIELHNIISKQSHLADCLQILHDQGNCRTSYNIYVKINICKICQKTEDNYELLLVSSLCLITVYFNLLIKIAYFLNNCK